MTSPRRLTLVTGATGGIGRDVCVRLAQTGRSVVATGRNKVALAELERAHPDVQTVQCDLTAPNAWSELLDELDQRRFHADEFVSAAGIVTYQPVGQVDEAALRAQLELNFTVPFLLTQRLASAMKQRGGGAIVLIASTLGLRSAPQTAAYAASKAALISAARSLALELAPHVRVNAVAPGVIDTDMIRVVRPDAADRSARDASARQLESLRALHPMGRLGTPRDVAHAVLYLLDAPWVTGSVLTVDGGLTAG